MSRVTPAAGPPGSANVGDCQVEDVDRTDILGSTAATAAACNPPPERLPVRFASSDSPSSPSSPPSSSPIGRRPSLLENRALRGVPVKALRAMYANKLRDRNYVSLFI